PRSFVPQSEKKLEERNMNGGGSGSGGGGSGAVKTPTDFLKSIRGRPVVVKLNSGVDYRGILACLDAYMNIAMEQTEEYVNGQLKKNVRVPSILFLIILYISTSKRPLAHGA
ncbi:U6 snRNA-associated Sm-like protein, partial [Musa troglodytarum]